MLSNHSFTVGVNVFAACACGVLKYWSCHCDANFMLHITFQSYLFHVFFIFLFLFLFLISALHVHLFSVYRTSSYLSSSMSLRSGISIASFSESALTADKNAGASQNPATIPEDAAIPPNAQRTVTEDCSVVHYELKKTDSYFVWRFNVMFSDQSSDFASTRDDGRNCRGRQLEKQRYS